MASADPAIRALHARVAAHAKWATTDPVEGTQAARAAFEDRFTKQVDPDGLLEPTERARRADHAKKAHMLSLALKSAAARRKTA
jgi:hypothetical protein